MQEANGGSLGAAATSRRWSPPTDLPASAAACATAEPAAEDDADDDLDDDDGFDPARTSAAARDIAAAAIRTTATIARTPPAAALPAQLQDPGSDPPPADPAGAGRQGRARHQGRGADHLSVAGRPVRRADAELAAGRRHFPQDHLGRRSPPAEGDHGRTRYPARDGHDRPHRRRQPPEAGDQARLRISAAAVGRHPRTHDEVGRAGADL